MGVPGGFASSQDGWPAEIRCRSWRQLPAGGRAVGRRWAARLGPVARRMRCGRAARGVLKRCAGRGLASRHARAKAGAAFKAVAGRLDQRYEQPRLRPGAEDCRRAHNCELQFAPPPGWPPPVRRRCLLFTAPSTRIACSTKFPRIEGYTKSYRSVPGPAGAALHCRPPTRRPLPCGRWFPHAACSAARSPERCADALVPCAAHRRATAARRAPPAACSGRRVPSLHMTTTPLATAGMEMPRAAGSLPASCGRAAVAPPPASSTASARPISSSEP